MLIRFWRDRRAATAIEYCFIASLIAMAIVGGATALGGKLSTRAFAPAAAALN